jgi:hypothetical protein
MEIDDLDESFFDPEGPSVPKDLYGPEDESPGPVPATQTVEVQSETLTLEQRVERNGNGEVLSTFDGILASASHGALLLKTRGKNRAADQIRGDINELRWRLLDAAQAPQGNVVSRVEIDRIMAEAKQLADRYSTTLSVLA